jgi:hypothetical protein
VKELQIHKVIHVYLVFENDDYPEARINSSRRRRHKDERREERRGEQVQYLSRRSFTAFTSDRNSNSAMHLF